MMKIVDEMASVLLEIDRITRWFLLLLILLYFISGYSMVGKFGMNKILSKKIATRIHTILDFPTLLLLAIHCCPRIYFFLRRRRK